MDQYNVNNTPWSYLIEKYEVCSHLVTGFTFMSRWSRSGLLPFSLDFIICAESLFYDLEKNNKGALIIALKFVQKHKLHKLSF